MSRKLLEGLWQSEKSKIMEGLPKTKRSLTDFLDHPMIELTNGEESFVEKTELEYLRNLIPETLQDQLMLPFIFQKKKSQYHVLGSKLEKWTIEKIMGITETNPFLLEVFLPRSSYFAYHYQRVQAKIPTIVFLTFQTESG